MKDIEKEKLLRQAQVMVWQMVQSIESEQDLNELRNLLVNFNNKRLQRQLDQVVVEKGYTNADFDRMLYGHDRK